MKIILVIFLAFILFAGLQCRKENNSPTPEPELVLPPITTQGLNTVGCKIDGKVWVPYSKTSVPKIMSSVARNAGWRYGFWGYQITGINQINTIGFYLQSINKDSLFVISNNKQNSIGYFLPIDSLIFTSSSSNDNKVHILRFDSIEQIISGTFRFTVIDTTTQIKHEITDGRFDLRFAY
jgi:hypothetical protein